ncbi:MAG: diaminopimelate epimerase [Kiritimatiellae bacterium]|nr:diaminopimelate epimerase [Kiritimatiellia bacterium]
MARTFWKMHGCGNDFILLPDGNAFAGEDGVFFAALCDRRRGIGADGVLAILPAARPDCAFRMQYRNADGGEAAMCGNGARCAAFAAFALGVAPRAMAFETAAGVHEAEILSREGNLAQVRVGFPSPGPVEQVLLPLANGTACTVFAVDTGVPHAVLFLDSPEAVRSCDAVSLGREIRSASAFAPAGTNADFAALSSKNVFTARTYERGVEDETLACGTGAVAIAAAAVAAGLAEAAEPVSVEMPGGTLAVRLVPSTTLEGPACKVFEGTL